MIKTKYIFLEKKSTPEIKVFETIRGEKNIREYLYKIKFYLPMMKLILDNKPEIFPKKSLYIFNSPCTLCDYTSLCNETYEDNFNTVEVKKDKLFITPTDIIQFEICPRAWGYKKEGIYPVKKKGIIEAGTCLHHAIESFLIDQKDPVQVFQEKWNAFNFNEIEFRKKDSPELIQEIATNLLKKFPEFWEKQNLEVLSIEERTYINFNNWVVFSGAWDLLCKEKNGKHEVIIDFKFSSPNGDDSVMKWLHNSDQVTGYALCLLHKKDPNKSKKTHKGGII
jgi:hypothetical protein